MPLPVFFFMYELEFFLVIRIRYLIIDDGIGKFLMK